MEEWRIKLGDSLDVGTERQVRGKDVLKVSLRRNDAVIRDQDILLFVGKEHYQEQ